MSWLCTVRTIALRLLLLRLLLLVWCTISTGALCTWSLSTVSLRCRCLASIGGLCGSRLLLSVLSCSTH